MRVIIDVAHASVVVSFSRFSAETSVANWTVQVTSVRLYPHLYLPLHALSKSVIIINCSSRRLRQVQVAPKLLR